MKPRMLVELAEAPLAIGTRRPRFSWEVPLAGRGRRQSAYQLLVATAPDRLLPARADLWDSGKVESSQSAHVVYGGAELRRNTDYYWAVGLWDEAGQPLGFSPPASFGTALWEDSDWQARWIGLGDPREPFSDPDTFQQDRIAPEVQAVEPDPRAPLLRKEFEIGQPVKRARAFVCGVGLGELRLNGQKVGSDVLSTPRTEFRKKLLYSTYDVTPLLRVGKNAVGLILGNGWFNGQKKYWGWRMQWYGSPRAILQLEIECADGSGVRICSDESWQGSGSPLTFNCLYDGEDYDARLEQDGWDSPGFAARSWRPVHLVPSPGGRLVPVPHQQGRIVETIRPVAMSEPRPGTFVYDLGRNLTGWARLAVAGGKAGEVVRLRFAEAIDAAGMLDPRSNGHARQADTYTLKGGGHETYEPRFTYHGFQYVEVTGFPGTPDLDSLEGCFVRTAVEPTGAFACGHELLNKIHRCTVQSQQCNLQMGVPTDDTQRTERLGWAGDAWSYAVEAFYNFDAARVFAKWIADFYDQQDDTGMVGMIVPQAGPEEDLVWSAAFVLIPWWQYLHYGDRRILEDSYPYLQRYLAYLQATGRKEVHPLPADKAYRAMRWFCPREDRYPAESERGHLQISQWGDHLATNEGSSGARRNQPLSIATAFYFQDVKTMACIAEVLGQTADARGYRDLADQIKAAFNERFFDPNTGYYDIGCQSAQAWPLAFGLVPQEHRAQVASYFHSSVHHRQQRLTTGYAGTKWAIAALAESGRHDIIWNRAIASDYPSWGYMLRDPRRTTITENWMGSGSLCHTTLGAALDEWFYWGLAGIRPDEAAPGFAKIIFQPYLPRDLPWARASLRTARGEIVSDWKHDGKTATLKVSLPANSTGTVVIAADPATPVTEGGVPAATAPGIRAVRAENQMTVIELGSGTYCFEFAVGWNGAPK